MRGRKSLVPRGPRGEKRPADAIARAVMIGKIATGEIEEEGDELSSAALRLARIFKLRHYRNLRFGK